MIISGPGHLIGSQQQVDQFFASSVGELPPWYKEWHEVLGDQYHMRILQTPYDVGEFFRGAVRDPHTPRVGFIANTVLSLGSGYDHRGGGLERECAGTRNMPAAMPIRKRLSRRRWRSCARPGAGRRGAGGLRRRRARGRAGPASRTGVSPRTQARDMLFG